MKIRLTKPLVITIPAGTILSTAMRTEEEAKAAIENFQMVTVSVHTTATLDPDVYWADYLKVGETDLVEGRVYDLVVTPKYGAKRQQNLKGWYYAGYDNSAFIGRELSFSKVQPGRPWYYGTRRTYALNEIVSAVPVS